jgi:hypothetical protein
VPIEAGLMPSLNDPAEMWGLWAENMFGDDMEPGESLYQMGVRYRDAYRTVQSRNHLSRQTGLRIISENILNERSH